MPSLENLNMKRRVISFAFDSAVPMISMPSGKACHDVHLRQSDSGAYPICCVCARSSAELPCRMSPASGCERHGFLKIAQFPEVGWKLDRWIDVGYWQLTMGGSAGPGSRWD